MLELFIHQFQGMSFGEELYTIAFTVFFIGGTVCCFIRKDKPTLVRPTTPSRRDRRF